MKVSTADVDNTSNFPIWLGFLRDAKKVTLQKLAVEHKTQRSNLSAYITTRGRIRNVSADKIQTILFELGLLPNGILTPRLHRWQVSEEMIPVLCELLALNEFERSFIFELGSGYGVFMVTQVASNILVFVNLPANSTGAVKKGLPGLSKKIQVITLDRAGDAQIQSLWMTKDDSAVQSNLVSLMG